MTIEIATVNAQEISYTTDGVDYFSNNDHRNLYLEQYCITSHYKHGKTFQGQGDAMHQCKFCGSELPPNAHFCGICGQLQGEDTQSVTQITTLSEPARTAPDTPPVFSNPSLPTVIPDPTEQQDAEATVSSSWSYL